MEVYKLQLLLTFLDLDPGPPDGVAGPDTAAALRQFQRSRGLTPDGIPGPRTAEALGAAVAERCTAAQDTQTPEAPAQPDSFWATVPNFTRAEFACRCGGRYCSGYPAEPDEGLVRCAQRMRKHFGGPVVLTSGLRCQRWNDLQPGSVPDSRHIRGRAMDCYIPGRSAVELLTWLRAQPEIVYCYAVNDRVVHLDVGN